MTYMKTYLLTGGTGFLGSRLACEIIKGGDEVIFLGRSKDNFSLEQRVKDSLEKIYPEFEAKNIVVLESDLSKTDLGLSEVSLKYLREKKIDAFWHLAANLSFKEKDRENVLFVNLECLKKVLNFVEKISVPIYYISSAYVSGRRNGVIFEDDTVLTNFFNNAYEESKFKAEQLIKEWGKNNNNNFIIFRPSIFIDPNGKTMSYFGYYAFLQSLYKISKKNSRPTRWPLLFPCVKNATLNLIPVDTAIKFMKEISSKTETKGKIFHLTNPNPSPIDTLIKKTFRAFGFRIITFKSPPVITRELISILYYLSFIIKPLHSIAKKLYYFRYYITTKSFYDIKNTKVALGQEVEKAFAFDPLFIDKSIDSFIKRMDIYYGNLHYQK